MSVICLLCRRQPACLWLWLPCTWAISVTHIFRYTSRMTWVHYWNSVEELFLVSWHHCKAFPKSTCKFNFAEQLLKELSRLQPAPPPPASNKNPYHCRILCRGHSSNPQPSIFLQKSNSSKSTCYPHLSTCLRSFSVAYMPDPTVCTGYLIQCCFITTSLQVFLAKPTCDSIKLPASLQSGRNSLQLQPQMVSTHFWCQIM